MRAGIPLVEEEGVPGAPEGEPEGEEEGVVVLRLRGRACRRLGRGGWGRSWGVGARVGVEGGGIRDGEGREVRIRACRRGDVEGREPELGEEEAGGDVPVLAGQEGARMPGERDDAHTPEEQEEGPEGGRGMAGPGEHGARRREEQGALAQEEDLEASRGTGQEGERGCCSCRGDGGASSPGQEPGRESEQAWAS